MAEALAALIGRWSTCIGLQSSQPNIAIPTQHHTKKQMHGSGTMGIAWAAWPQAGGGGEGKRGREELEEELATLWRRRPYWQSVVWPNKNGRHGSHNTLAATDQWPHTAAGHGGAPSRSAPQPHCLLHPWVGGALAQPPPCHRPQPHPTQGAPPPSSRSSAPRSSAQHWRLVVESVGGSRDWQDAMIASIPSLQSLFHLILRLHRHFDTLGVAASLVLVAGMAGSPPSLHRTMLITQNLHRHPPDLRPN